MLKSSKIFHTFTLASINHIDIKKEILWMSKNWNNINFNFFIYYSKKKLSILRAPFIHNKSKEQFELTKCFCKIYIKSHYKLKIFKYILKTKSISSKSQHVTKINVLVINNFFS